MMNNLYQTYEEIYEIDTKKNNVKNIRPCAPEQSLDALTIKLENRRYFARAVDQVINDDMLIFKAITLISNTSMFNYIVREWHKKQAYNKTCRKFKFHSQDVNRERHAMTEIEGQV